MIATPATQERVEVVALLKTHKWNLAKIAG
jgi:hypothetical protein